MRGQKLIAKWLAPEVKVVIDENEMSSFNLEENLLTLGRDNEGGCHWFYEHIKERHNFAHAYRYSLPFWTLMHELGHYFTNKRAIEGEKEIYFRLICACLPKETVEDKRWAYGYFDLTKEYQATEWAINFIKNHRFRARLYNWIAKHQGGLHGKNYTGCQRIGK